MGTWLGIVVGVLVALAAIGTVAVSGRRLRAAHHALHTAIGPPWPVDTPLDPYELAYLCGREGRVVVTAVLRMHAEGRLRVRRRAAGWITAVRAAEPRDDVERAVLAALERQRNGDGWSPWPVELGDDGTPVREVRERLVLGGLIRDDAAPIGTLHRHPVTLAYYYRARARFADTLRAVPAFAVVGVVVALVWHAWPPLLLYPPLLWAARRHRDRHEEDTGHHGEVTEAGKAAVRAVSADERGAASAVDRQVLETARSGPETLPAGHVLRPPPAPPRRSPPPRPRRRS
ncbi:TIGR04222 domain-containing membrane protein [Streptomyces sp. NPDC012746]|uniref:TIGR04222 domain-containing membrane protein n=1 Tax=Streptomyces sp. NPDC012746 TaxID=3364845 RepID=UPI0036983632